MSSKRYSNRVKVVDSTHSLVSYSEDPQAPVAPQYCSELLVGGPAGVKGEVQ
jgi:hypothetical protein